MAAQRRQAHVSALNRLKNDYARLKKDPIPLIHAEPDPANMLTWHYCVIGPPHTAYEGGYFHGKLQFPPDFPFKPPSILMMTPNGRFKINQRLCLSISDFHPDSWNPAWSVGTILNGLLSFMVEEATTYGSIETPNAVRQRLARDSGAENLRNEKFCELFPELVEEINSKLEKRRAQSKPVMKPEKQPQETTKEATNATADLRAAVKQEQGLSNLAIFAMITLLVLSAGVVSNILYGES